MAERGHEGLSKKNYRTYSKLYRDPAAFEVVEDEVLWELGKDALRRGVGQTVEAWSCGCSAGEEVFSLLMSWEQVLAEHFPSVNLSYLGTDISHDAIDAANRAEYGEHAVQDVPAAWIERCFDTGHDEQGTGSPQAAAAHGNRAELLLAALLHDIGKGHAGDHSVVGAVIAERFAARAGLDAETAGRLMTAARLHLLLPTVATRRDIADEQVIEETAAQVGDERTAHLLYLLAVADARATGPDVWSPWKAQLMRALYLRMLPALAPTTGERSLAEQRHEEVLAELAGRLQATALASHLAGLPPSYLLSTPSEQIGAHLELIERARANPDGTAVGHDRAGGVERLTLVTADRPGILSRVAGTLAAHQVSVLGGVAYTRADGTAPSTKNLASAPPSISKRNFVQGLGFVEPRAR